MLFQGRIVTPLHENCSVRSEAGHVYPPDRFPEGFHIPGARSFAEIERDNHVVLDEGEVSLDADAVYVGILSILFRQLISEQLILQRHFLPVDPESLPHIAELMMGLKEQAL